jgi:hypothetical protein
VQAATWFVQNELPKVAAIVKERPGYDLLLVGHSLGAGGWQKQITPTLLGVWVALIIWDSHWHGWLRHSLGADGCPLSGHISICIAGWLGGPERLVSHWHCSGFIMTVTDTCEQCLLLDPKQDYCSSLSSQFLINSDFLFRHGGHACTHDPQ